MPWIALILILILMLALPEFRKYGIVVVLVAAVGIFLLWRYQEYEEKQSKERIAPTELSFEDVTLNPAYSGYELTGRIINNSKKYTLKGFQLKLIFRDCDKNDNSKCVVIAEENEYIYIDIPPEQARDFKEDFYPYPDLKVKGKMIWDYTIEFTKAE
jgi:hypothetical protein